jgi:hypothetical protein
VRVTRSEPLGYATNVYAAAQPPLRRTAAAVFWFPGRSSIERRDLRMTHWMNMSTLTYGHLARTTA